MKTPRIIWLVIISLFIAMQIYHLVVGNYFDFITAVLTVFILLFMIWVYFLIAPKRSKTKKKKK